MRIRCPACGATMSLDVLIAHDDARALIVGLTALSDDLAKSALRYLTLFRPASRDLSFDRVAKLLNQLLPDIKAEQIERNRHAYPAPRVAWIWAFGRCIEARDAGKLTPPLTTHGFLYETLTFWKPDYTPLAAASASQSALLPAPNSKLRHGVAALAGWAQQGGQDE